MDVFSRRNPFRGPIRAVILDWAGTAVDYGCIGPVSAFVEAFRTNWVEVTVEEARAPMGLDKKEHLWAMFRQQSVASKWEDVHGSAPGEFEVENLYRSVEMLLAYAVANRADPIPGLLETIEALRGQGVKIGSTSAYPLPIMQALAPAAAGNGYRPDCVVCSSDVPDGRPYPWMCIRNALELEVYPFESMVKIGDTIPDVQEGLNAGMWTVGLTKTGNELGLTEEETAAMGPAELKSRLDRIEERFKEAGAHFTVEGIWELPAIVDRINGLLERGERP